MASFSLSNSLAGGGEAKQIDMLARHSIENNKQTYVLALLTNHGLTTQESSPFLLGSGTNSSSYS